MPRYRTTAVGFACMGFTPDSNVGWANVGPTSGRQYRRLANVSLIYIVVWDRSLESSQWPKSRYIFLFYHNSTKLIISNKFWQGKCSKLTKLPWLSHDNMYTARHCPMGSADQIVSQTSVMSQPDVSHKISVINFIKTRNKLCIIKCKQINLNQNTL